MYTFQVKAEVQTDENFSADKVAQAAMDALENAGIHVCGIGVEKDEE